MQYRNNRLLVSTAPIKRKQVIHQDEQFYKRRESMSNDLERTIEEEGNADDMVRFKRTIGWSTGVCTLLDAIGIENEQV